LEPVAKGLHITPWSRAELARQAVAEGILDAMSPRRVRRLLHAGELQPHRTRFWKTARLTAEFFQRATKILWCSTHAASLARGGSWVVCADESPNFQILERAPIRRALPGSIEQREFEYRRHGTVTVLVFLVAPTGRMEAVCLETQRAVPSTAALRAFRRRHRHWRGVSLIHDGDPTHTGGATPEYLFAFRRGWHECLLPPDASWLNPAELLLDALKGRYLKRGSWSSRAAFLNHLAQAWPEDNRLYAHPFAWKWTIPKMKAWFAKHTQ
jgi:hypothetical protein